MVRNKKGFTLIELLIVVVIIGILAAIAIPKFAGTKSKAYIASMKSDLKNMVLAQESYFTEYNTYVADHTDANFVLLWTPTTGVVPAIGGASATTFNATATHAGSPGTTCGVYAGAGARPGGAPATMNEGEVACW
jgi:prepilin-type N-terminal cleavage/methylation domain-containing protein